jgi:hypothetical protein
MTRIIKRAGLPSVVLIEAEPPGQCETCGALAELRPYGPGGKRICARCMERDPQGTVQRMAKLWGYEDDTN